MFAPWWCVNEGTTGFAFANAIATTNDPVLSLTKINKFTKKIKAYWKIADSSSVPDRSILKCVILTPLVKCARFDHKMTHNNFDQPRMLSGSRSGQNEIFLYTNDLVEEPTCPSPFNSIDRSYATRCKLHSRIQTTSFDWAKPDKLTIFVNTQI